ncbi:hypothetical protein PRIPAC_70729, partial [Pristionchus pacificus]
NVFIIKMMLLQYRMSGRPRGRPRKDGSDPVPRPKVVKDEPVDELAQSPLSKRSSPRKRKPTNFDGFVVEAPGLGVIGEGADIIKEIEEEAPLEETVNKTEEEDDNYTPDYKPVVPSSAKRRIKLTPKWKAQSSVTSEGEMVRMDDIDDDLEHDPMKRVERRGRKKKKNVVEAAPVLENQSTPRPKVVKKSTEEDKDMTVPKEEEEIVDVEGVKEPQEKRSPSPHKSVGSPSKTPISPSKPTGVSRRKQIVAPDDDEEELQEEIVEEEVADDLLEEDLVDVESFEVQTIPMRTAVRIQNNKPFKCADCGAAYRREAYLLNHLALVHQDECAILSSAERSAKRAGRRPERMIPRERPGEAAYKFGCDLCERRFLRWEGLVVHQKQIHKEVTPAAKEQEKNRDYGAKCPVCLLYFFGNHSLSEHVSKEHPDHNRFIFACDLCGMGFMHWARVRAHKTQIHNVAVKYTQGYLKKNPEMAKIVEAQRMRKAVERNRAKRMLEKGIFTGDAMGRDFNGLSSSEMNEYMYLMPPTLEPEISGGEEYEEDDEQEQEIVEEEGIIDPSEMMNIRMVPLPPSSIRRPPLPPRMMGYRDNFNRPYARVYPRGHHQLAALHQRVTQLDRRDLEILNRRMPSDMGEVMPKEEHEEDEDGDIDVEREEEELIEEEVVEDGIVMDEEVNEMEEEERQEEVEEREDEGEEIIEDGDDDGELPPQLDMYA